MKLLATAITALALLAPASTALAAGGGTGSDLQVSGSASTGSPGPGQTFMYTFQVKNSGPDTATAANNSVTVNAQVKVATCALPAGQTTTLGLVAWKNFNSAGMFENFHLYGNDGVQYDVITNFYDGTAPLTNVINLACQQSPNSWIGVANFVYVTGTVSTAVLPGSTVATPVIYASVVQVLFFKDG